MKRFLPFLPCSLLFLVSFLLLRLSAGSQSFADRFSHRFYQPVSRLISAVTGRIPFSLVELLLYTVLFFLSASLLHSLYALLFRHSLRPLSRFFFRSFAIASLLLFLYTVFCGINYRRTGLSEELGLTQQPAAEAAPLYRLCSYLVQKISENEAELSSLTPSSSRQDTGVPLFIYHYRKGAYESILGQELSTPAPSFRWLRQASAVASRSMEQLGATIPGLSGSYPSPKPVFFSYLLSVQQTTGVYSPFTIEANYNRDMPYYDIPFTMCHELSHLRGYMREDEANMIAVLASAGSEDSYFRYSGYLSAWVYAGNALYALSPEAFSSLYEKLPDNAKKDLACNNAFFAQFEGKISETQTKVNDSYLKAQGQTQGVQSYDAVTRLLLLYYEAHGKLGK